MSSAAAPTQSNPSRQLPKLKAQIPWPLLEQKQHEQHRNDEIEDQPVIRLGSKNAVIIPIQHRQDRGDDHDQR